MKRLLRSVLGVTLLEIMLVLAIAAMVIVMSIRYYQNATNSQNTNVILQQIQAITAAADNLAIGSDYTAVTTPNVTSIVGSKNMITPFGGPIAIQSQAQTTYEVLVGGPLPTAVCTAIAQQLKANSKFSSPTCSDGHVTYTYDSKL